MHFTISILLSLSVSQAAAVKVVPKPYSLVDEASYLHSIYLPADWLVLVFVRAPIDLRELLVIKVKTCKVSRPSYRQKIVIYIICTTEKKKI